MSLLLPITSDPSGFPISLTGYIPLSVEPGFGWLSVVLVLVVGLGAGMLLGRLLFRRTIPPVGRPQTPKSDDSQFDSRVSQSQKMEAIGRLAGGIAHDFNNLLTVINGNSELARMDLPPDHPVGALLDDIMVAGEKAAALTTQLLLFSRQKPIELTRLDLNETVEQALCLLRRLIGERIVLIDKPGSDVPRILGAPALIHQVVLNLAVNARDAMPQGGKLTIQTRQANDRAGKLVARLSVQDTGCGMSKETLPHIFEPFFTTKEVGKGTGLGLATVYGIVRSLNGEIRVRSSVGWGTQFEIDLPAAPPTADELTQTQQASPVQHSGKAIVLLVEDEESVRTICQKTLDSHGFEVLCAAHPEDALRQVEQAKSPIDLLLTDVVMPGMSGRELARALRRKHPHLRTLYMSGYVRDELGYVDSRGEELCFIQKPFTPSSLVARVRLMLAPVTVA